MALLVNQSPPCVLHEDEHLLVVNKPCGLNTHSPSPYAGEGIYDWLRNREPRWSSLAIIHRLDKSTSGLIVFAKTKLANQSLTQQFTDRAVKKRYLLLTDVAPTEKSFTVRSGITRTGDCYSASPHGEPAETKFTYLRSKLGHHLLAAEPLTGRTHQIRVHAELKGFPILGDTAYQGAPFPRVCLHAEQITFGHPATNQAVTFHAPLDFFAPPYTVRSALIEPDLTNAFRLIHGAADGQNDLYFDCFAEHLLVQAANTKYDDAFLEPFLPAPPSDATRRVVAALKVEIPELQHRSLYLKRLTKDVARTSSSEAQPHLMSGEPAPEPFVIRENGVQYEISFQQGYSVGLFLDQRDNRRRLLTNYIAPHFTLFEDMPSPNVKS